MGVVSCKVKETSFSKYHQYCQILWRDKVLEYLKVTIGFGDKEVIVILAKTMSSEVLGA